MFLSFLLRKFVFHICVHKNIVISSGKISSGGCVPFLLSLVKKSRIRETQTLLTDADSRTDINLKRLRDLSKKNKKTSSLPHRRCRRRRQQGAIEQKKRKKTFFFIYCCSSFILSQLNSLDQPSALQIFFLAIYLLF